MANYEHEIIVGALLHDIGKFWQRAQGIQESHPYLSAKFIDLLPQIEGLKFDLLRTIVLHHHDSSSFPSEIQVKHLPQGSLERRLAHVVCEADNISSAWDRGKGSEPETFVPLQSVFSAVSLDRKPANPSARQMYFPPHIQSLSRNAIFPAKSKPSESTIQTQLSQLWEAFVAEVKELPISCFKAWYETLFFLLQKYTVYIPSAAYMTKPDIPLFDHAKTTAAIAVSLWHYIQESGQAVEDPSGKLSRYLLIKGDISGIQSYLYNVRDPQLARPGTAKRLRGRSFSIELLVDCFAEDLLSALGLYRPNLLLIGGGNFVILAPKLDSILTDVIPEFQRRVEKFFFKKYQFGLSLVLASEECSNDDLREFGSVIDRLQTKLVIAKRQKYQSLLTPDFFIPYGPAEEITNFCPVCGTFQGTNGMCASCNTDRELGRAAANALFLVRTFDDSGLVFPFAPTLRIQNWSYFLLRNPAKLKSVLMSANPEKTLVYWINQVGELKGLDFLQFGVSFRYLGNTVPFLTGKNLTLSFEMIAGLARGSNRLGVLKADVDDLGAIFALGLQNRTISRIHTLSHLIERFFAGYLNCLCQEKTFFVDLCPSCTEKVPPPSRYKLVSSEEKEDFGWEIIAYDIKESEICANCRGDEHRLHPFYINYSGGDDLVVIGPWDQVIELAEKLHHEFREYTGNNPALTLSAGIALISPKFPISEGIKQAEASLELAKSHLQSSKVPTTPLKNSIAVFGECVIWDKEDVVGTRLQGFHQLLALGHNLEKYVQSNQISKSFLYSLLQMWQTTFFDTPNLPDLEPARHQRKGYVPLLYYQLARQFAKNPKLRYDIELMIKPLMPWIRIPVSWVSLRTRK